MICEYICCCGIYISEDQMKTLVVVKNVTWYEFERDERREREEDLKISSLKKGQKLCS